MRSCFLKLNLIPSHSNQPSSLPLELIDRFLYEAKIDFKLIKIQLCKAKMSVMRVGSRTLATSKIEFFVAIIKKIEAVKCSPKELHLGCYNGYENLESISVKCYIMARGSFHKWP